MGNTGMKCKIHTLHDCGTVRICVALFDGSGEAESLNSHEGGDDCVQRCGGETEDWEN